MDSVSDVEETPSDSVDPSKSADLAETEPEGTVREVAKLVRVGTMLKVLLGEVRDIKELDDPSRKRLAGIYEQAVEEITGAVSTDLQEELNRFAIDFDEDAVPTDSELRVAKAQLVGWLEGLYMGINSAVVAQEMLARQSGAPAIEAEATQTRPGTYL